MTEGESIASQFVIVVVRFCLTSERCFIKFIVCQGGSDTAHDLHSLTYFTR